MARISITCTDNHKHEIKGRTYADGRYCKHCSIWVPTDMMRCICCRHQTRGRPVKAKYSWKSMKYEW